MRRLLIRAAVSLFLVAIPALRAPAQLPPARDLTGRWVGSANLTNEWRDQRCVYNGSLSSVEMWLQQTGSTASGGVKISIPPTPGSRCPPLAKMYTLAGSVSGAQFHFTDPAGNSWSLNFTTSLLGGRVGFSGRAPNPNEALAAGSSLPSGDTPLTRLDG